MMLLPGELLRSLLFCQVRSEFLFRHCCVCSFLPCSGKQLLHLHLLTRGEADSSEQGCFCCLPASVFGQLRPRNPVYGLLRELGSRAGLNAEGEVQAVISGS